MARVVYLPGSGDAVKILTKLEFRRRLGFARNSLLNRMKIVTALPDALRADVMTMDDWLKDAGDVRVTDPDTIAFTDGMLALLADETVATAIGATAMTAPECAALRLVMLDPHGPEPIDP